MAQDYQKTQDQKSESNSGSTLRKTLSKLSLKASSMASNVYSALGSLSSPNAKVAGIEMTACCAAVCIITEKSLGKVVCFQDIVSFDYDATNISLSIGRAVSAIVRLLSEQRREYPEYSPQVLATPVLHPSFLI